MYRILSKWNLETKQKDIAMSLELTRRPEQSLVFFTPSYEQIVLKVRFINNPKVQLKLFLPATFTLDKKDSSQVSFQTSKVKKGASLDWLHVVIDAVQGDEFTVQAANHSMLRVAIERVHRGYILFRLRLPNDYVVWRDELLVINDGGYSPLNKLPADPKQEQQLSNTRGPQIRIKKPPHHRSPLVARVNSEKNEFFRTANKRKGNSIVNKENGSLILVRRAGETLMIGDDVTVTVESVHGDRVTLVTTAPKDIPVIREEVYQRIKDDDNVGNR